MCSVVGFAGVGVDVMFILVYLLLLGPIYLNTMTIIECSAEGVATVVALVSVQEYIASSERQAGNTISLIRC